MKVLLVEDSKTLRVAMSTMLAKMGHGVAVAENGLEALAVYKQERPGLILMDVNMPVMDGYEAARRLRATYAEDWVPIIFLSAAEADQDLERGIEAGGDDYLVKPVSQVVLHAKMRAMQRIDAMRQRLLGLTAQLASANRELEHLSHQDGLTGLANRRYFDKTLADEMPRAVRSRSSLALILLDVDFFKAYNDHYGHPAGDHCLQQVAAAIRSCCRRPADVAARYGGEEFALVLPDTDAAGAMLVAEAVRAAMERMALPHAHSQVGTHVSVSAGICALVPGAETVPELFIAAADQALYRAKEYGRNRCVLAGGL